MIDEDSSQPGTETLTFYATLARIGALDQGYKPFLLKASQDEQETWEKERAERPTTQRCTAKRYRTIVTATYYKKS